MTTLAARVQRALAPAYAGADRRAIYLTMRDGVRIAVDVWLPAPLPAGARLPAILHQTRYFRRVAVRPGLDRRLVRQLFDPHLDTRRRFLARGYAWVDVCARGSGASFGRRPWPWSDDEVADGAEVVTWITRQPWSSGLVGATGVSYGGTASDFLLANRHPAVRAIAPRFSLWDVYPDIAFPGGVHNAFFTREWGTFNARLDANDLAGAFAHILQHSAQGWRTVPGAPRIWELLARPAAEPVLRRLAAALAAGVAPVDDDPRGRALAAALRDHVDNFNVHVGALRATFRDDPGMHPRFPEATVDTFSPHARADALRGAGAAVLGVSGWLDGAYPNAAIKRHHALGGPGDELLLGPWDHGGAQDISPFNERYAAVDDHDGLLLAFFDRHLQPARAGAAPRPRVRYFTLGEERWKEAATWPPPGFARRPWYLAPGRALDAAGPPAAAGADPYRVDPDLGTGPRARWNTVLGTSAPVGYPDQAGLAARALTWTSAPLRAPLEVTGHAVVRLWLSADAPDLAVFAYLQDVAPDGRVRYVTEGQLRALHRRLAEGPPPFPGAPPARTFRRADAAPLPPGEPAELAFELLPVSWRFGRGHAVRLAVTGADRDHFAPVARTPPSLRVHRGGACPSRLELPVPEEP